MHQFTWYKTPGGYKKSESNVLKYKPLTADCLMQEFVIIAYDGTDSEALQRRMQVREAHLAIVRKLKSTGNFIEGGAMLDENGNMNGSVAFVAFPSRSDLDAWLQNDPYVIEGVWKKIEIKPFRCAKL